MNINLTQACNIIEQYSYINNVDTLTGIERMVKYFTNLSPQEKTAVQVFMEETKQK